ncbi:hypothetical protein [Scytonema sp. NUACC26]|uniref:hypothetical protein n=1 Tax=Scytonema sp. NUACC26 TaxID=3140176 RepID=UPI0034DCAE24
MVKLVQATYTNGELILREKLDSELEGKILQIMIFESSEFDETIDSSEFKIKRFLERVKNYSFQLPPDYKFNREEIYDR